MKMAVFWMLRHTASISEIQRDGLKMEAVSTSETLVLILLCTWHFFCCSGGGRELPL
jgi:hypothetical protein